MRTMVDGLLDLFTADGTPIASTASESLIYRGTPIPGTFMHQGRLLRARYFGKASCTGTPTLTFRVRFGNDLSGTLIGLTEALTMGSGVSNVNWLVDAMVQARLDGATGKLLCNGFAEIHTAVGTVLRNIFSVSGYDAPAEVTADLVTAGNLCLSAQWSASDAANTLTPMHGMVQAVN